MWWSVYEGVKWGKGELEMPISRLLKMGHSVLGTRRIVPYRANQGEVLEQVLYCTGTCEIWDQN